MTNVVPFFDAAITTWEAPDKGTVVAAWNASDLTMPDGRDWLMAAVEGSGLEPAAESYWVSMPALERMTVKLASFITPGWPDDAGGSLLKKSVTQAVEHTVRAMEDGQVFEGRFVGVYLYWLTDIAKEIARIQIYGITPEGVTKKWEPFRMPLAKWADEYKLTKIIASRANGEPDDSYVYGIRIHMIAAISKPEEAGYVYKYSPHG